jgi:hypothetical protein
LTLFLSWAQTIGVLLAGPAVVARTHHRSRLLAGAPTYSSMSARLPPLVHVAGHVVAGVVQGQSVKLDGDVADVVEEGVDHGHTEVRRLGDIDGGRSNRGPHRK